MKKTVKLITEEELEASLKIMRSKNLFGNQNNYDYSDDSTEGKPIRKTILKLEKEISSDEEYQPRKTTAAIRKL